MGGLKRFAIPLALSLMPVVVVCGCQNARLVASTGPLASTVISVTSVNRLPGGELGLITVEGEGPWTAFLAAQVWDEQNLSSPEATVRLSPMVWSIRGHSAVFMDSGAPSERVIEVNPSVGGTGVSKAERGAEKSARVVAVRSGEELRTVDPNGIVSFVKGSLVAWCETTVDEGEPPETVRLKMRNLESGEMLLDVNVKAPGGISDLAISPNGEEIVFGCRRLNRPQYIAAVDVKTGGELWRKTAYACGRLAFVPDGKSFIVSADALRSRVNAATGETLWSGTMSEPEMTAMTLLSLPVAPLLLVLTVGERAVSTLGQEWECDVSPDGKYMAFESWMYVHILDTSTGRQVARAPAANDFCFAGDSKGIWMIVYGDADAWELKLYRFAE